MNKLAKIFSGTAGEYLVASELTKRGYIASMTIKNMPGIDIVVTNAAATKLLGIQVKTKQDMGSKKVWTLSEKDEKRRSANLFYVFVNLPVKKDAPPECYIFPSSVVAARIAAYHQQFLAADPKHAATALRSFVLKPTETPNNWTALAL